MLPRRCVVCGVSGDDLCAACRGRLPRLDPPWCARCGAPTAWPVARCRECAGRRLSFSRARAVTAYDGDTRLLVSAWKERGLRGLAREAAAVVAERLPPPDVDVLTFVPADDRRRRERGYHPAERLAAELARAWSLEAVPLLRRHGRSRRQRGLTLAERKRNVAGAFTADAAAARRRIALVDDVYTSGATAAAASLALRAAGARDVQVVTFARALRDRGPWARTSK